jgi:tRNA(fMet)-specific endonuclease VapC
MNLYVLDTDTLSLFQRGHAAVCQRCGAAPRGSLSISVITVEEQFLGWYTRARQAKTDAELAQASDGMVAFARLIKQLQILSFTLPAIERYHQLKKMKLNVGKKDLRIAAIALQAGAAVVTRNARDFGRVPTLQFEDWSK